MNTLNSFLFSIPDGNTIATAFKQSLLKKYFFDADISFCTSSTSPLVYAKLSAINNHGYIAFSSTAVNELICMSLGPSDNSSQDIFPSSTALKILHNIAQTMCSELGDILCGEFSTEKPDDFDIYSAFQFSVNNNGSFWLQIPGIKPLDIANNIPCELTAVMQQSSLPLSKISEWKVGSFMPLGIEKDAEISILQGKAPKFKGILGQKSHHIAIKITQKVPQ